MTISIHLHWVKTRVKFRQLTLDHDMKAKKWGDEEWRRVRASTNTARKWGNMVVGML